jgi:hypothetical protein
MGGIISSKPKTQSAQRKQDIEKQLRKDREALASESTPQKFACFWFLSAHSRALVVRLVVLRRCVCACRLCVWRARSIVVRGTIFQTKKQQPQSNYCCSGRASLASRHSPSK